MRVPLPLASVRFMRHEGLERTGLLLAARACGARLRAKLAIEVVDLDLLLLIDEAGVLQQLAEVRDGDLARLAAGGERRWRS